MEPDDQSSEPSEPGPSPLRIDLIDPAGRLGDDASTWLLQRTGDVGRHLSLRGELRIKAVGDREMADAHDRYKGVRGTTDVLTFDLSLDAELTDVDIDALVCVDEAARQAFARSTTVERELLLYVLHAVLHCTGYDDTTPDGAARMHDAEDRILTAIGVGPVYSATQREQER